MPFTIQSNDEGRFVVHIIDEPEFIRGLWMAPTHREPFLNSGDWLVLAFAIWNIHDRPEIATAIEVVKSMENRLRLGIRPFEVAEEFRSWCDHNVANSDLVQIQKEHSKLGCHISITGVKGQTPIWISLRNGVIVGAHHGQLGRRELQGFIESCFIEKPT